MTLIVKRGIWHDEFLDVPEKIAAEALATDPSVVEAGFAPQSQQPQPGQQQQKPQVPRMSFDQLAPYAQRAISMRPKGVAPNPNMDIDMETERNNEQAKQLKSMANNVKSKQKLQQAQMTLQSAQMPSQPEAPAMSPEQQMQPKMAGDSFVCNTTERTPKGQFPKGRRVGKSAIERIRELMGGENGRPFPVSKQPAK